jgi:RNA-dependent RNA polymerase
VEKIIHIPDVTNSKYCFTDGIGKISCAVAEKVSKKLGLQHQPSAYQIRLGGCKGVLAVSPNLEGEQIQVRDSM